MSNSLYYNIRLLVGPESAVLLRIGQLRCSSHVLFSQLVKQL